MGSSQAEKSLDRALQAAEYAADQISQAKNMPEEASGGGGLSSMLGNVAGKMKIPVGGDCPREVLEGTETEARKKMEDIRVRESGAAEEGPAVEAAVREMAAKEAAAHRGVAARANILGTMGSTKEAIRNKMSMPSDIVDSMAESLAAQRHGGSGRANDAEKVEDVNSKNTPVGAVGSIKLKANDVAK